MARIEPRRPELATAILVLGAIAYAVLCGPAIGRRGYPPIDPFWLGVTYMWFLPVCVSALFDSVKFPSRRHQLVIYALVTAFFNAGTMGGVVPRNMNPVGMLLGTILYGPFHLIVLFTLEYVLQWLYSFARTLDVAEVITKRYSFSLFTFFVIVSWLCVTIGFPIGYKSLITSSEFSNANERAELDWKTNAYVYHEFDFRQIDDATIQYEFDPETGLEYKPKMADLGFADTYNRRIEQLIAQNGLPEYSIKSIIPEPDELIGMLDSTAMNPIDSFPVDLNENIHLMRRGTLSRWGGTSTSTSDSLSIATKNGLYGIGDGVLPVHVKTTEHLIYIRNGSAWVGAFLPDGRMVVSASR